MCFVSLFLFLVVCAFVSVFVLSGGGGGSFISFHFHDLEYNVLCSGTPRLSTSEGKSVRVRMCKLSIRNWLCVFEKSVVKL